MKIYVDADSRLEDTRSSAQAFIFAGLIGIIVLILLHTNLLPIRIALPNLIMATIILGIVSLIFLGMGIHAMLSVQKLTVSANEEKEKEKEILQWLYDNCRETLLDLPYEPCGENTESELYFARYGQISETIAERYPDLKEEYIDYLAETFYNKIFPEQ